MRPARLNPLFASVDSLDGVGPKIARLLARLLSTEPARIIDLIFHLPSGIVDRRNRVQLKALPPSGIVTLEAEIVSHKAPPSRSRVPWRVTIDDGTARAQLVYFNAKADWLSRQMPVGERRLISGPVEWFKGSPQIVHPDHVLPPEQASDMPLLEPRYPLTTGLTPRTLQKAIRAAMERLPELDEWQTENRLVTEGWSGFASTLRKLHRPDSPEDIDISGRPWRRLAYDECLASQLAIGLVRGSIRKSKGRAWTNAGAEHSARQAICDALPFSLTRSQQAAVDEIVGDLSSPDRMIRLLQGDVGSGKTIVALLAMAHVNEAGGQAALMAPTDLLARQHYETIKPMADKAGIGISLLTGRMKAATRDEIANKLSSGEIEIAVGTHALFQESVAFSDLGLVVVDEQHRFGVHQRLALSAKGTAPDLLVMTATPIPRTLVLTYYGDMDVSRLMEKPAGRRPVATRSAPLERMDEVVHRIKNAIDSGQKAYWICPLVEESEAVELTSAETRHSNLKAHLGDERVGLVHGRMKSDEKDAVMAQFRDGSIAVLVATTVVEVGVDVPDATIMVIEHAERFGLAQLHQLRGRVGRSDLPSSCLLLYHSDLGPTARARLAVMRETDDGFRIAEEDLRLRGEGDVLGLRQSGMPGFRFLVPDTHADLLEKARDDARYLIGMKRSVKQDDALRLLLYLFGRDDAVRLMRAG